VERGKGERTNRQNKRERSPWLNTDRHGYGGQGLRARGDEGEEEAKEMSRSWMSPTIVVF
jgi:hypothetical protein